MNLSLLIDARSHAKSAAITRAFLQTTARQCAELLSVGRLTEGGGGRLTITVGAVAHAGVVSLQRCVAIVDGNQSLSVILRALEALEQRSPDTAPPAAAASFGYDSLAAVHAFLLAQQQQAAGGPGVVLFASAYEPYTQLYSSLAGGGGNTTAAGPPLALHCVAVDARAVGVAAASLGPGGTLYCCSPDPADLRSALQAALSQVTLGPGDAPVPVVVRLGSAAALHCLASRPYLSPLLRCCTVDGFPAAQEEKPSLAFHGGPRLVHSGFEVGRCTAGGATATLVLEALLPPENVDETFLHDNSWLLSAAPEADGATALLAAAYAQFAGDVLVLRCGGGDARLAATHQLAIQSTCFAAYFVSRTRLLLRQMLPAELRRAAPVVPLPPRPTDDATTARLRALRAEIAARGRDPAFSIDGLLRGGVCLVAAQLRPEREYSLQLAKLFR